MGKVVLNYGDHIWEQNHLFVQNVQKSAKIIFRSNTLVFVQVRAGVWKFLKLFCKNELDVRWCL